jgi:two-component sensor histidine kinase
MRKILYSRLPERLEHRVPPLLVQIAVGIAAAAALVSIRLAFSPLAGERAPYALNFLAVVLASVVAGWRSGLVALTVGQLIVWYVIVPVHWSFEFANSEAVGGFFVATVSEALILLVIALYQREIDKRVLESERRMELLDHALNEIDHRTRNNYATVLALVQLQAQRAQDAKVRTALQQVSDRIHAIAGASDRLAMRSSDLDRIRLDDHLCELVAQIERGIARDGIEVECSVEEVSAGAETATSISLIVNELVTNAIKHAFNGERSGSVRVSGKAGETFELIVQDNGQGIVPTRKKDGSGLGSRLVENFVRQLGAQHEVVSTDKGTTHRLVIPNLN